jgi:type I restriction enzyme S subunit
MNEHPYDIPEHWDWSTAGEIGEVHSGSTPSTEEEENFGGGIAWLTPADLSDYDGKYISEGRRSLTEKGLNSCSAVLLPKGSVLFSSRAPVGYTVVAANPIATNQGFKNLILEDGITSDFVFHYLKGNKALAESYASGTTFTELSATRFARIPIPVPPLSEQRRIVAKIEELFSELEAGVADLKWAKKQLQRYRQSVLQAAVEGRLTKAWREERDTESADKLLSRADEAEETNKYKKRGKMTSLDDAYTYPLPQGWAWAQVGDVAKNIRYGTSEKATKQDSGLPMLRMGDISDGKLHFDDLKYLPAETQLKDDLILEDGDVLFNRTNSAELVGKTAVYKSSHQKATYASYLVRAKLYTGVYNPDLLAYYINSAQGRQYIASVTSQQVGQANVNATKMSSMPLPIPPYEEQREIVNEVERLLSVADEATQTVEREIKRAERLRQSILKQAFSGKLLEGEEALSPNRKGRDENIVAADQQIEMSL